MFDGLFEKIIREKVIRIYMFFKPADYSLAYRLAGDLALFMSTHTVTEDKKAIIPLSNGIFLIVALAYLVDREGRI